MQIFHKTKSHKSIPNHQTHNCNITKSPCSLPPAVASQLPHCCVATARPSVVSLPLPLCSAISPPRRRQGHSPLGTASTELFRNCKFYSSPPSSALYFFFLTVALHHSLKVFFLAVPTGPIL